MKQETLDQMAMSNHLMFLNVLHHNHDSIAFLQILNDRLEKLLKKKRDN